MVPPSRSCHRSLLSRPRRDRLSSVRDDNRVERHQRACARAFAALSASGQHLLQDYVLYVFESGSHPDQRPQDSLVSQGALARHVYRSGACRPSPRRVSSTASHPAHQRLSRLPLICFQVLGTVWGAVWSYFTLISVVADKRPFLDGTLVDPSGQWTGRAPSVFYSASIVWGLISPRRFFSGPYLILFAGFVRTLASSCSRRPWLKAFSLRFSASRRACSLHHVSAPQEIPGLSLRQGESPSSRSELVSVVAEAAASQVVFPIICSGMTLVPQVYVFPLRSFASGSMSTDGSFLTQPGQHPTQRHRHSMVQPPRCNALPPSMVGEVHPDPVGRPRRGHKLECRASACSRFGQVSADRCLVRSSSSTFSSSLEEHLSGPGGGIQVRPDLVVPSPRRGMLMYFIAFQGRIRSTAIRYDRSHDRT